MGTVSSEQRSPGGALHALAWRTAVLHPRGEAGSEAVVLAGDDLELIELLAAEAQARELQGHVLIPDAEEGAGGGLPRDAAGWAAFWAGAPTSQRVVLVLALKASPLPSSLPLGGAGHEDVVGRGAARCAEVTAAVVGLDRAGTPGKVFVVTRGARQVSGRDVIAAGDHGLLQGLAPAFGLEFSRVWGGVVDLPATPGPEDAAGLLTLVSSGAGEDLAAVRGGQILVARLVAAQGEAPRGLPVRADGTYLVTGGLGGVGREVLADMVGRGARHLVLLGRKSEEKLETAAATFLRTLRERGVDARYVSVDCADAAALAKACEITRSMPPVRGIVHGAGVVPHRRLVDADAASFALALGGKFAGAWWLHLLSLGWPLDFFVQLSSVSALWGTEGYGAYGAANGGLDAVAALRTASALPGLSVLYGPWQSEGIADAAMRQTLSRMGVGVVTPAEGCAALGAGTQEGAPLLVVCPVDWPLFTAVMSVRRARPLFSELVGGSGKGAASGAAAAALSGLPERAQVAFAREHVARAVAAILGYGPGDSPPEDVGFFQLGLDSVMTVDLAGRLSADFGLTLTVSELFDHPTVTSLAEHIIQVAKSGPAPSVPAPVPAPVRSAPTAPPKAVVTPRAAPVEAPGPEIAQPKAKPAAEPEAQPRAVAEAPVARGREAHEPIAIIGMAGRFPGADSVEEFWQLLRQGQDGVGPIPADRWDAAALHDPKAQRPGSVITDQGAFLKDVARFDAGFFRVPTREAENLDPQQRQLLEMAWHALEDASVAPTALKGTRTGVFVGISNSDYAHLLERGGLEQLDAYYSTGTSLNAAAGRLSYLLGLNGPAMAVDTACSSSLVALHLAVRSLREDESDCALAGGVNVIVTPVISAVASRAHMLAPDGRCKTFSAKADGYGRAEGAGVLVLKRLRDAQRDGDRILALIHGSAVNQDGASSGLTVPSGRAQEAVISTALADAGVEPASVSYLEAHGTGTSLGDPIEIGAAWSVLGQGRRPGEPLMVGSVKSNIGHCESAAGVAGVIKTVLALRQGMLPANLHCETLNPRIAWRDMNVRVLDTPVRWPASDRPRLAGVSGFGFTGTNAHVVIGEAPAAPSPSTDEGAPGTHPVVLPLSAPDAEGLARLSQAWEQRLASASEADVPALAAEAGAGRAHFRVRRAVVGRTLEELRAGLREQAAAAGAAREPRVGFLFSGQGSQYFGMGRTLYETEPVFRQILDACDRVASPGMGISLRELLFDGADKTLVNQTRFTQPALVALELSLAALWESWGVRPSVVMGHSVGEIAAAIHSGVMSLEAGLTLIVERGRLMQETAKGAMLAVPALLATVEGWISGKALDVAAVNGPESIVVSGAPADVEAFSAELKGRGVNARSLVVSHAFHSRLMDPMLDGLEAAISAFRFGPPKIPLITNLNGALAGEGAFNAGYWRRHARQPVLFHQGAQQLATLGVDVCVEIGPDLTLGNLLVTAGLAPAGGILPSLRRGGKDRAIMAAAVKGLYERGQELDWARVQARSPSRAAAPRYPFAATRYWSKVAPARAEKAQESVAAGWGREVRSPLINGRAYSFQFTPDYPRYLDDHRLYRDAVVVAGAAQVGTVLSALARDGGPITLEDLHWPSALIIRDGQRYEVQVVEATDSTGVRRVSIHSIAEGQSRWEQHLQARLGAQPPAAPAPPDVDAFIASAERHFTGEDCYGYMRALGYTLGASFCWIAEIWTRGDEALIRYAPPEYPEEPASHPFHPGLIDSFFQGPVGFAIDEGAEEGPTIAIPFAAAKLSFRGLPKQGATLYGYVRALEGQPMANERRDVELADLHMFTRDGTSVMVAERFRVRRAPRALIAANVRGGSQHAYELTQVPLPQLPEGEARRFEIAVLGGAPALSEQLCGELRAAGHQVRAAEDWAALAREAPPALDLILDARFREPAGKTDAADALSAATRLAASLQRVPRGTPYAVLCDSGVRAAPIREALWGLMASLEAEDSERRLLRVGLGEGLAPGDITRALSRLLTAGLPETRLEVTAQGVLVTRLARSKREHTRPAWNGSVLITGGLGGLGLSVASTLARQGAGAITLMGRSPADAEARQAIEALERGGVAVAVVQGDVTNPADCARAVAAAAAKLPLRGVFHLAGALDDSAFDRMTPDSFAKVFAAKASGAATLAAAVAGQKLDAFVLFSSVSAVLGSAGQVNYAAANGYLNGLAQALRAAGVPATSVNWGPWIPEGKGGMASAGAVSAKTARSGVRALVDEEAAPLLELACTAAPPVLIAMAADFDRFAEQLAGSPRARLVSLLAAAPPPAETRGAGGEQSRGWLARAVQSEAEPEKALREAIRKQICTVLGEEEIDEDCAFVEMGLDSIMMIDLRNRLANALGAELSATTALEHPTLPALTRFIMDSGILGAPAPQAGRKELANAG
jgi:acyl transferase domain-containing protein/NAD(P)-dependent dehydrogenase (short-subunit alcohol dehydrogenase family)/acyl carrier protein